MQPSHIQCNLSKPPYILCVKKAVSLSKPLGLCFPNLAYLLDSLLTNQNCLLCHIYPIKGFAASRFFLFFYYQNSSCLQIMSTNLKLFVFSDYSLFRFCMAEEHKYQPRSHPTSTKENQ